MSRSSQPNPKSSQSSSRLSTSRSLLQYKNGFFQGYVDEYTQRHGRGVYFWNTGEIYYGDWSQDHMEGEGIFYFALGGYVYGTFLDDRVHGYAVLCFSNGDYTAGFWERGILNGKVVQHSKEENDWCLEEYKDGQCIRMLMKGKGAPPLDNFSMLETYSLKKLLEKGTGLFAGEKEGEQKNSSRANLDFLAIEPDGWYHGNIQARGPHGLGIVCYSEHKSDRGLFKNGALTGLGRSLFSNGDVYDGFYKEGKFQGIGVYFKSETDQYLYGMYEGNECVQALTLGNGYPHELMRTLKADFHLDTAEFVNKETETEVLTLTYNEQNDQNPIQEQESPLQYVESSKHKFEENNNNRNNNGRKRVEEQRQETTKSIQDSELSARSQRRAAESEKIRKETETQSSVSQQGYPYDVNSIKREKGGSRSKVTDSARIKNSSYSDISDDQNEFLVRGKSVQASEVLDQKPVSKGTVDSQVKVKSTEKIAIDNYPSRGSDIDKEVTVHVTSVSYPVSPKYDYHSEAHHNNQGNGRDSGVHYSQKQVQSEPQRVETFSGSTGQQRWDSPSRISEGLAPYVVRASEMIEKVSTVVPYEAKPNCSNIAEYTIVDRSPNAKTSVQSTSYTPITPAPAVNDTTSYYQNQQSQGSGSVVANITSGIDVQVRKIMDKIFTGNTNNNQNIVSALNIPPNPNTETDTTRTGSYLLSAPEIYPKSSDRSPTFAQAHNELNLGFDYKFTNNSSVYTGSYVENKEKNHMDHLTTDWNIKVFPSLSSSLINSDTKKMGELPQATASFGLIPSAASEESLASKVLQAGIRQSQTSNNFLEVDAIKDTRERAPTGKFGGANTEITNMTVMPESYKAETTHKSYNFSGNNQISTSHEDIDTKSYLKAKTPINKKIEHSNYEIKVGTYGTDYTGTDYTKTYDLGPSKLYDEHNLKSGAGNYGSYESPSGRGSIISKTDTWSVPATMQKIGDVGGSLVYNEKQGELSASELLQKYGGYDKSNYHHQTDLTVKRSSLYEASSSDIFDNGSISNRYELKTKEYTYTPEKKQYEIPVSSSVPVYSFEKESSSSPVKLEEDLYKIILLKLELLVKEQSKATEAMDDVKKSLNDKLDQLFRQERRESEGFKLLLNQKLDLLFKEKTLDLSRDQLTQIHQELIGNQKQVSASFNGVNKKLDMLLLKQGRLSMETEENLVNKLVTKHTRHESIQSTKHAEDHRRSLKNHDSNENVRSEIFIADSSADYNATTAKKRPGADSKVFKSESAGKNSQLSVTSQKEQKKEASNVLVKDIAHHAELSKASAQNRRVDNDMCNVSDDAMDYASVASDTTPIKVINSMQPKSKELSIKNEHTINLIQYESELRSAKSQQDKQYRTANKSDKEQVNTPRSKTAAGARSMTPTPQSKNHVEISYRNNNDARSPRPITSQNSSMIMDTQPPTYRQSKAEIYNSGKSPRATNQVSFKGRESVPSNVNTNTITLSPEKRDMAQWHVFPLCAQDSLIDEPEEIIEEERQDSQTPSEERKTQALPSPANFTNRSHVSKGQFKKPNNNHNRANSISSQSSYNVFDLKSYNRLSIKNGEGSFRKGRESKDLQDKVPNNTAHSVFDNFVVTSNNNDIPVGSEYVRIEKNSAVHRNMSFMRKDMESPNAPKFTGSAKKQTQKEVDLYEEEGKHKRKSAQKETAYFRNEEDVYDNCSTGRNQDGYQHASPMRARREQVSPNRAPKTVYQEGRVGTMRWRLEIEDMANDTECDRIDEMESAEAKGYYANTGFDRRMKSVSAMNSPISHRREMDSLLKTVNIGKDISQYDNYMYSPNKNRPEDVVSSRAASYRKTEVKVPSLPLGHDAKGYECYEDTLRNQGYYMQNGAHQAKQGHW